MGHDPRPDEGAREAKRRPGDQQGGVQRNQQEQGSKTSNNRDQYSPVVVLAASQQAVRDLLWLELDKRQALRLPTRRLVQLLPYCSLLVEWFDELADAEAEHGSEAAG
jgi:hypothetical protein